MGFETIDRYQCQGVKCEVKEEVVHGVTPDINWRSATLDAQCSAHEQSEPPAKRPLPQAFVFCPLCVRDIFGRDSAADGDDILVVLRRAKPGDRCLGRMTKDEADRLRPPGDQEGEAQKVRAER